MKTLLFCTSYASSHGTWEKRYRKWINYYLNSKLVFDQMLVIDDGSPVMPSWPDFEILNENSIASFSPRALFHFSNNLGRPGPLNYPGWFRSYSFAAQYAKKNGFKRVVHIESDAYLTSQKAFEFVNNRKTGWHALWSPRYNFPESGIQVICEDQIDSFEKVSKVSYADTYAGNVLDAMLPYTSICKELNGDRFGEDRSLPALDKIDYICQLPLHTSIINTDGIASIAKPADPTLLEIHLNKIGKASDKWASYLEYYHDHAFQRFRHKEISLFECGVQNGGSLETWAQYFPLAKHIVGCDISPKCRELKFSDERINVVVGNVTSTETKHHILDTCPSYDIMIDDGSHHSADIFKSFLMYFPHLNPGGCYVVEDANTLYLNSYGGGLDTKNNALYFFINLIHLVNLEHLASDFHAPDLLRDFFGDSPIPQFLFEGWIDSIEFRNSIIVINKSHTANTNGRGDRLINGEEFNVFKP